MVTTKQKFKINMYTKKQKRIPCNNKKVINSQEKRKKRKRKKTTKSKSKTTSKMAIKIFIDNYMKGLNVLAKDIPWLNGYKLIPMYILVST